MNISKIGIEYVHNKLCMVIYYDNNSKKIIKIKDKFRDSLFNLIFDIYLSNKYHI